MLSAARHRATASGQYPLLCRYCVASGSSVNSSKLPICSARTDRTSAGVAKKNSLRRKGVDPKAERGDRSKKGEGKKTDEAGLSSDEVKEKKSVSSPVAAKETKSVLSPVTTTKEKKSTPKEISSPVANGGKVKEKKIVVKETLNAATNGKVKENKVVVKETVIAEPTKKSKKGKKSAAE